MTTTIINQKKKKSSIWDKNFSSPYGTYTGEHGNTESWKAAYEFAFYSREKAEGIIKGACLTAYDILEVTKSSSQEEIQKNWRRLCLKHHPDKGGDREKFELVIAAWSILKEEKK